MRQSSIIARFFTTAVGGEAMLEVCLGILESTRNRKEFVLSHQVPARDHAMMPI
jgi:hypothetical protein